jgi:hypothetical protein
MKMKQQVERMRIKQQRVRRTNGFVLGFFSWSNHRQGTDRTRGELGAGRALQDLLPNRRSRLIGSENGWHGISETVSVLNRPLPR